MLILTVSVSCYKALMVPGHLCSSFIMLHVGLQAVISCWSHQSLNSNPTGYSNLKQTALYWGRWLVTWNLLLHRLIKAKAVPPMFGCCMYEYVKWVRTVIVLSLPLSLSLYPLLPRGHHCYHDCTTSQGGQGDRCCLATQGQWLLGWRRLPPHSLLLCKWWKIEKLQFHSRRANTACEGVQLHRMPVL